VTVHRSLSDVVRDILWNVQDIFRSEVRLAKAEIRQEVMQAASSAVWVIAGLVSALSAWIFLLWTTAYAFATIMPLWAATLLISIAMAVAGSLLPGPAYASSNGSRQFRSGPLNRSGRISNG
jgi:hypothetical protein